jgi:hypothetical protein
MGNHGGRRPLGTRRENNIKMSVTEIIYVGLDCLSLTQDRDSGSS